MNQQPLPEEFIRRIRDRRGHDWKDLMKALNAEERAWGLRVNTLKIAVPTFRRLTQLTLNPVAWCDTGFSYPPGPRPGLHPYHFAGLYYMQDPSAMFPVEALDVQPSHKVLDLCAAPGGKSTHIAAKLGAQGLLLANEVTTSRVASLLHNLERFGSLRSAVTSCRVENLAGALPAYFDRVLVDAPCSGEGLFRREPRSRQEWHPRHAERLARTQLALLTVAFGMLKPGGRLVYSTCTFAEEENEHLVDTFVDTHPEASIVPVTPARGLEITPQGYAKLLPHLLPGEGHFCAVLYKKENRPAASGAVAGMNVANPDRGMSAVWETFAGANMSVLPEDTLLHQHDDKLYLIPQGLPELSGCNLVRPGVLMGRLSGRAFIPEHGMALAAFPRNLPVVDFHPDDQQLLAYLRGETLSGNGELPKGWLLVACDGFPLGLGKHSEGRINNRLPKGLRLLSQETFRS